MIKGIDISSHNGYPLSGMAAAEYNKSDFVIVKATQGNYYVNPYCDNAIQGCITDGKLWGFYHYAGGCDPVTEAKFFVDNCKNYFKHGIPVIDWEREQNQHFGNTTWVKQFVDKVYELTGVWCLVYVSLADLHQVANCAPTCGLWLAQWGVSSPGNVSPWETWTIWQWTSNNGVLDQNYAQLDKESWLKIANGGTVANSGNASNNNSSTSNGATNGITTSAAVQKMAEDVIAGMYGNGETRKQKLYDTIQKRVNELCK